MRLTFEPWSPEYDTAQHSANNDTGPSSVDTTVELEAWQAVQPQRFEDFRTLHFIDGRRRLEAKIFAEWQHQGQHQTAPGLLGTFAVGVATLDAAASNKCRIDPLHTHINRVFLLEAAHDNGEDVVIAGSAFRLGPLRYAHHGMQHGESLEHGLQRLMRRQEANIAADLKLQDGLLLVDGPLDRTTARAVGYIKTLHDLHLPPSHHGLLYTLEQGQRTPIFALSGRLERFAWFVRLGNRVGWHQGLSGVVRMETASEHGLGWAQQVADWSCRELPRFAAQGYRDPRAPQQLMPVSFLESDLGRRMGDLQIVRRRIQEHLQRHATPGPNSHSPNTLEILPQEWN